MKPIFNNAFHDGFGTWPLAYIPYGGADIGEISAVAEAVGDGDDAAYYEAWVAAGDRLAAEADDALSKGRRATARDLFLRASAFYATSFHPIYGEPVDPRLVTASRKQTNVFNKGLTLSDPPVEPLRIPFEDTSLAAYFIPAEGYERQVRPLLILTNGYDGTFPDMYFASAVAASRRGYHCLLYHGPGQGEALIEQGLRLRPDWETVVKAVVDVAAALPLVDPEKIVLNGWSLGGHLAPRAASGEHRLAACIADPGLWSIAGSFRGYAIKLGAPPDAAANLGELDEAILERMDHIIQNDRKLRWSFVQRGYWVHGVNNLRDYLRAAEQFTMDGRAELIRCPTLFTVGEGDPLGAEVATFFDALRCPKEIIRFTNAEGAGGHCEMANRSSLNRKTFDWLDGVLNN